MKGCYKKSKAQVSMEYLLVMGFVFLTLVPIVIIYAEESRSMTTQVQVNQLYKVSRKITEKSEEIYYLGSPSKAVVKFYMPDKVTNVTIANRTIIFTLMKESGATTQISQTSNVNMTGEIKTFGGIHNLEIKAYEGYVNIKELT